MNDMPDLNDMTDDEKSSFLNFKEKVRGTNINEDTLLATDYLNHFNEIVMTLEMVPMMPELLEDAKEWKPKTYQQHFEDSNIADKDLAIEAYPAVPRKFRDPFEKTIVQMGRLVAATLVRLENGVDSGDMELVQVTATSASQLLQRLMDHASGIIHGSDKTMDQTEIDAFLD